jgi:hypothetical protein
MLRLGRLDGGRAVLVPLPGRREVAKFAQPRQLVPVAAALTQVLGRRIEPVVELPEGGAAPAGPAQPATDDAARKAALDLPLVRRILDVFPDATVLSVEDEQQSEPPADDET